MNLNPLGDLNAFQRDPITFLGEVAARNEPHPRFRLGPVNMRLVTDPDSVYEIIIRQPDTCTRDDVSLAASTKFICSGIATVEYDRHRLHRLTIKDAFLESAILRKAHIVRLPPERYALCAEWLIRGKRL